MKTIKHNVLWFLILALLGLGSLAFGKTPVSDDNNGSQTPPATDQTQVTPRRAQPAVGEDAARKYFDKKPDHADHPTTQPPISPDDHYLAIHLGGFLSSDSYKWGGTDHVGNPGRLQAGLTYKLGPVGRFADFAMRADFIGYQFPEGNAVNMSILPMILFPEAGSAFPLYFGVGIGPGVFFSQIGNESVISLNYELVGGVRVFDVIGNTGFFVESGIKNEVHLLSDGQFNGFFLSVGALFVF